MNKWLEKETDKSIIKVMVNKSGTYFQYLFQENSMNKYSKKYFTNQFRILKSKMTYRPCVEFLYEMGLQISLLSNLEKRQRDTFFEIYISEFIFL